MTGTATWLRDLDRGAGLGRRLIGALGIAAVVLTLPAFVLVPPAPAADASRAAVAAYYHAAGTAFQVYGWLIGLSIPLMLAHLVGVVRWLNDDRGLRTTALLYAVSGVASHASQLTVLLTFQAVSLAAAGGDAGGARALSDLANVGLSFYAIAEGARLTVAAAVVLGTGVLPRWVGGLAGVAALLCLVGSLGAFGSGLLAAGRPLTAAWYPAFLAVFAVANLFLLLRRGAA